MMIRPDQKYLVSRTCSLLKNARAIFFTKKSKSWSGLNMYRVVYKCVMMSLKEGENPKFAHIYFSDTEHEIQNRLRYNIHLDIDILTSVQECLKVVNPYIQSLKYAAQLSSENPETWIITEAKKKKKIHKVNMPVNITCQVAVSLQLFPFGEDGYHENLNKMIKHKHTCMSS